MSAVPSAAKPCEPASGSLESLIAHERDLYTRNNPNSLALYRKAKTSLPGGNTRTVLHYSPFPITVRRAQGAPSWTLMGINIKTFWVNTPQVYTDIVTPKSPKP